MTMTKDKLYSFEAHFDFSDKDYNTICGAWAKSKKQAIEIMYEEADRCGYKILSIKFKECRA
ncbi:MAG TPA: hypothetical protein VIK86_07845 [Candidatus Paceibacterota bacterium]